MEVPRHVPRSHRIWRQLGRSRAARVSAGVLGALALGCVLVPWLGPWPADVSDLATGPTAPSWAHPMGTDYFGRDLLARVFSGGRVSLLVGLTATLVSLLIGVVWGGVAGLFDRRLDSVMMRTVDVLDAFPGVVVVILVTALFTDRSGAAYAAFVALLSLFVPDPGDPSHLPVFQLVFVLVVLGALSWLTMARLVRGQMLALRERPFVEAARSIGVGRWAILLRHLLPNALGPTVIYAALTVPQVMLAEAFLSFIGLGTQEPLASWGLLVASGAETMDVYPWLLVFPAFMLTLTLLCLNILADALRDAMDPRLG